MGNAIRTWPNFPVSLAALVLLWTISVQVAAADPARPMSFRHLSTAEGLSQNTVMDVHQDAYGYVWLATENGLDRFDGYRVHRYQRGQASKGELTNDYIWQIAEDDSGLWLATDGGGVAHWNRETDRFSHFRHEPDNAASLSDDRTRAVLLTEEGLWIGTQRAGLNLLDIRTGQVKRFRHDPDEPGSLPNDAVFALLEDPDGSIWVGTDDGLARLTPNRSRFQRLKHAPTDVRSLSHNRVRTLHLDHAGTLWIGTFGGGLNALERSSGRFTRFIADESALDSLSDNHVWKIFEDGVGRLWVGTANGLNLLQPETRTFVRYSGGDRSDQLSDSYIMSLYQDRGGVLWVGTRFGGANTWNSRSWELGHHDPEWLQGHSITAFASDRDGFWVGTFGGGLTYVSDLDGSTRHLDTRTSPTLTDDRVMSLLLDNDGGLWVGTMQGGLNWLQPGVDEFEVLGNGENAQLNLPIKGGMSLFEDSKGSIWIGSFGDGAVRFEPHTKTYEHFLPLPDRSDSLCGHQARAFAEDYTGAIWVGTESGLCRFESGGSKFQSFRHHENDPSSLADDSIYALYVDSNGGLWVGTGGGGLSHIPDPGTAAVPLRFITYSRHDGLSSNMIYAIQPDSQGKLWLSSNNGLTRFDPGTGATRNFRKTQGLQGDEFHYGASHRSEDGTLFFGGANGYNMFLPGSLEESAPPPNVVLTGISKMNQPLADVIPARRDLTIDLDYRAPSMTLEYAALDFTEPHSNRYSYRLEGLDTEWIDAGSRRTATYTNLSGGNYRFQVRAASPSSTWSQTALSIAVRVQAAPWTTPWAYALYTLMLGVSVWLYIRSHRQKLTQESGYRRRLEEEVAHRTEELNLRNAELKKLTEIKSEFLARMSHEIRSPINGILGMTELLSRSHLGVQQQKFTRTILSSGQSLLHIVNDILDFSKLESKKVKLEPIKTDLEQLLNEIVDMFAFEAKQRGLSLVVNVNPTGLPSVQVDALRLKQVLINLLNNALKFTEQGDVTLLVNDFPCPNGKLRAGFTVSDTGIGIALANQQHIFDSFSQEDGSTTRRFGGTGLGLTICRDLLALMNSKISLISTPGAGSAFSFEIMLDTEGAAPGVKSVPQMDGNALIVSTSRAQTEQLKKYLSAWGITCRSTPRADTALEILTSTAGESTDLLIVDDQFTDFTGSPMLSWIQQRSSPPLTRVIVLQPFGESLQSYPHGVGVVVKPVKRLEFLNEITGIQGESDPARSTESTPQALLAGRVLLVEDNPVNQEVFGGMLNAIGCEASFAADGQSGLQAAASGQFDAILMDLQLPDVSGIETSKRIRALKSAASHLPIIALTANATEADRKACFDAGMNAFLAKPCSFNELAEALSEWLPVSAPIDTGPEVEQVETSDARFDELALARIKRLKRPDGSDMLTHAIGLFFRSADEGLAALRTAQHHNDAAAVRFNAHKLKSGCANLGAVSMAELCRQLEEVGRAGSIAEAAHLIDSIERHHAEVVDWLEEHIRASA